MGAYPFISVIIPTCYRERLLIECIDSIVVQNYPDVEVIVIDQAEPPLLGDSLRRRYPDDPRIKYLHAVKAGASRARNLGLSRAAGAVIAFIDDDARADAMWLTSIADAFSQEPKPALMAGRILPDWDVVRPEWYPVDRQFLLGLYDIGDACRVLPEADMPIAANMAGLREVLLAYGGFDEALGPNYFCKRKMLMGEESLLSSKIRRAGYRAVYHPQAQVRHHIAGYKLSRRYFLKRHFWEGVTVATQMGLLGQIGPTIWPHWRHHGREICMAAARAVLPSYHHTYSQPNAVTRMLALSRLAYSAGVLYEVTRRGAARASAGAGAQKAAGRPGWLPDGRRLQHHSVPDFCRQFVQSRSDLQDVRGYNRQMLDIFATLRPIANTVLLDVGASPHGFALEHALELGVAEYCGIGLGCSSDVLVTSRKGVGALLNMNADELHLPSNTFDRIITLSTFEHFLHPDRVLREMHRVLKPGGAMLVNFQPVWTSVQGHHLHHIPGVSKLLPPWSHLRWDKERMRAELGPVWPATAPMTLEQVVAWIYESDEINRIPIEVLRKAFYDSPFRVEWLTPIEDVWSATEAAAAETAAASLPWSVSDLRTKGISALLVKPF